ncbi:glycosyltransferase family 2 protein [Rhodanobacter aciditrophus]|uniref:Glycosyltransferase family 2 protein n=1 Tax=Rhodanobacter aciditrophus TaxID=1623218 RepID=A0ABW4B273_9GAMM
MIKNVSAVLITRDVAHCIRKALDSLSVFEEVIVYDNGSTDGTLEILAEYKNVQCIQGEFLGFGPTKQKAVSYAKNDWVLSLDADESLSADLIDSLGTFDFDTPGKVGVIWRHNYFLGQRVRYSGWGKDWLVRLFNRSCHNFNDAMVHENINLSKDSQTIRLAGTIDHDAVTDVGQMLEKVSRYSSLRAATQKKRYSMPMIVVKSLFAFFRTYVLRLGILDGKAGLVISVSNANGVFWKNTKRYFRK